MPAPRRRHPALGRGADYWTNGLPPAHCRNTPPGPARPLARCGDPGRTARPDCPARVRLARLGSRACRSRRPTAGERQLAGRAARPHSGCHRHYDPGDHDRGPARAHRAGAHCRHLDAMDLWAGAGGSASAAPAFFSLFFFFFFFFLFLLFFLFSSLLCWCMFRVFAFFRSAHWLCAAPDLLMWCCSRCLRLSVSSRASTCRFGLASCRSCIVFSFFRSHLPTFAFFSLSLFLIFLSFFFLFFSSFFSLIFLFFLSTSSRSLVLPALC